jgi:HD-like signal output (HDOD) protein
MKNTESLVERFNQIKTLPHVAIRLVKMISEDTGSVKDYERVIRHDPALVMRVFKLVNSAYFALTEKVETLADAMVVIGQNNLRNMVVLEALRSLYQGRMAIAGFSGRALWNHGVATSHCCRMIAEQIFGLPGEDAFLCGLMHDVGLMVAFQTEPELFDRMVASMGTGMPFVEHETLVMGTTHCETGFWLARAWKLPATVQLAIRDHHKKIDDLDPSSMTGIIQLGELIATRSGFMALPETQDGLSLSLVQHLREHIDEYLRIQQELPDEMEKTREIYRS